MAYQGRFSSENRKPRPEAQETPVTQAPRAAAPQPKAAPAQKPQAAAPAKPVPAAPRAAVPASKPAPEAPQAAPQRSPRQGGKRKSKNNIGSVIFYTIYFVVIAIFLGGMFLLKGWLNDWLTNYEAAQPTTKCEEVFVQYFENPDWAALYDMTGVEATLYESSDAFVAYMNSTVTGEISYVETSAGLTGGHKYLLKQADQVLGYFTMVDKAPAGSELPDWQLGEISLNYTYPETVTVQKLEDQIVYINGVALTEEHTIRIGTTLAERYLPSGLKGPELHTQFLSGLMREPTVTATDAQGNPLEVSYDPDADLYTVHGTENTISDEEYDRAMGAAKTYALRMIEKASKQELAKYFDSNSESYKTIVSIDPWMQEWFFSGYEFANEKLTSFYRHSDDLFSVHIDLSMFVTRTDDTVKEYVVDHSFFFEKKGGTWKCINMINVDISQQLGKVRLSFMSGDTLLSTNFYSSDITTLLVPMLSAPDGQVFVGWVREDVDENGKKTLTLVFAPDENGYVTLPDNSELDPMILYPLFEPAQNSDGGAQ